MIQHYDGHIAQYLGNGLLVYFGYPRAHEDDAQRAVCAGLGMVEALGQLNTRLAQEREVQLAVRLGIHTGLVVVGDMGGGTRQEQLALGETPNITARLQGVAAPNTLVMSAATFSLLGGFFACESLGLHLLKGLPHPIEVYQVRHESTARSRKEAAMEYRSLGRTGVQVSPLCLGGMLFGQQTDEAEALTIVDHALDAGLNFLDTANIYTYGRSEEIVGRTLQRNGRRARVVLATKVHGTMDAQDPNAWGTSRRHILEQCDASLRRLQTDMSVWRRGAVSRTESCQALR